MTGTARLFAEDFGGGLPHRNYDVAPDDTHFVMVSNTAAQKPDAIVIVNWFPELRARLRAAR